MRRLRLMTALAWLAAFAFLSPSAASAQTAPPPELPKVGKPVLIGLAFANDGRGRVMAADEDGKVEQYLLVWADGAKEPDVVVYVLAAGAQHRTVIWGRGPVNRAAFNCAADAAPQFGEKSFWVATSTASGLKFEEVTDGGIAALFRDITRARHEMKVRWRGRVASSGESNILLFMSEKNRKKWLERGWLRALDTCVKVF